MDVQTVHSCTDCIVNSTEIFIEEYWMIVGENVIINIEQLWLHLLLLYQQHESQFLQSYHTE